MLLALVALAVAGANALPTAAASAAPVPGRQETSGTAFVLSGRISCGTPTSCLAIPGSAGTSGSLTQVVVAWNGTTWRSVAVPTPDPTVALINLAAVSCKSATSCVVVGGSRRGPGAAP